MPWAADDMRAKGAKRPQEAARIANAILRDCQSGKIKPLKGRNCDATAIILALSRTNRGGT